MAANRKIGVSAQDGCHLAWESVDIMAAEWLLGLLDREERILADRLMLEDSRFAAATARWERTFALAFGVDEPVAPPAWLWDAIEARPAEMPAEGGLHRN